MLLLSLCPFLLICSCMGRRCSLIHTCSFAFFLLQNLSQTPLNGCNDCEKTELIVQTNLKNHFLLRLSDKVYRYFHSIFPWKIGADNDLMCPLLHLFCTLDFYKKLERESETDLQLRHGILINPCHKHLRINLLDIF